MTSETKTILIQFGSGNLDIGLPSISTQLITENEVFKYTSELPAAPEITKLYWRWQKYYLDLHKRFSWGTRIFVPDDPGEETNISANEFNVLCDQIGVKLNDWLITRSFQMMERRLVANLLPCDHIQVIIETDDNLLRRVPWHLWNFFEVFPQAEIIISPQHWENHCVANDSLWNS